MARFSSCRTVLNGKGQIAEKLHEFCFQGEQEQGTANFGRALSLSAELVL
jgi:hypothetical protein